MRATLPNLVVLFLCAGALCPPRLHAAERPRAGDRVESRLAEREDEERMQERRAAWIEEMHRTPDGMSWREIERANWRAAFLARQSEAEGGIRSNLWDEVGSANLAGRTHVTTLDPQGGGGILVGSANGGVWSGNISGAGWTPRSDAVGYGVEHLIAVPGSPEVWVSAGGGLIHATTDRGTSWFVPTGLPETTTNVIRAIRDLSNPRKVYLLVDGIQGGLRKYYLCRSDNGGVGFAIVSNFALAKRPDIWMSRTGGANVYAMWGQTCQRSTNFGVTFTTVGTVAVNASSAVLTGSEAGAPTLYAGLNVSGTWKLYRSSDAGASWSYRSDMPGFYETLCAAINNTNLVFWGDINCHRSTNGGTTFSIINDWSQYYGQEDTKLHADIFGIDCVMQGGSQRFFFDTDGGTYISTDDGHTVDNVSEHGLAVSQYYSILSSANDPYLIGAGSQDQGWQNSLPSLGQPFMDFVQAVSGDYGHTTSSDHTLNMAYSCYPGFTLVQQTESDPGSLLFVDFPSEPDGVSFLPFLLADPVDLNVYYFCARHIWRCTRVAGETYSNTMLPFDFGGGSGQYVTAFAISPADPDHWYAVTNGGRIYYSTNAGTSWTQSTNNGPFSHYFYGTAIEPSPIDPLVCYVGGNGYTNPGVWKTVDGGVSFTAMGDGLPSTMVLGLALAADGGLYAAAESGPYFWDGTIWNDIHGTEAPLTTYWDVEYVPALDKLRFATYGRGIWDYTIAGPAAVANGPAPAGLQLSLGPNPAADRTTLRYRLAAPGKAKLEVFDLAGRLVLGPREERLANASGEIPLLLVDDRERPLASGVYLVRLSSGTSVAVAQLLLTR